MSNIYTKNNYYQEYLDNKGVCLKKHHELNKVKFELDYQDFIDFMYREDSITKSHVPRPYYEDGESMREIVMTYDLGYGTHNATEQNWGYHKESQNIELKDLFGIHNIKSLGINPDTALLRLLKYAPGNCIPLHKDTFHSFRDRFGDRGRVVRFLIAISPWDWGHFIQLHDNVWSNWHTGEGIELPPNVYHVTTNSGISDKITLSITGFASDS
jgi:hypothetical protein